MRCAALHFARQALRMREREAGVLLEFGVVRLGQLLDLLDANRHFVDTAIAFRENAVEHVQLLETTSEAPHLGLELAGTAALGARTLRFLTTDSDCGVLLLLLLLLLLQLLDSPLRFDELEPGNGLTWACRRP